MRYARQRYGSGIIIFDLMFIAELHVNIIFYLFSGLGNVNNV